MTILTHACAPAWNDNSKYLSLLFAGMHDYGEPIRGHAMTLVPAQGCSAEVLVESFLDVVFGAVADELFDDLSVLEDE